MIEEKQIENTVRALRLVYKDRFGKKAPKVLPVGFLIEELSVANYRQLYRNMKEIIKIAILELQQDLTLKGPVNKLSN